MIGRRLIASRAPADIINRVRIYKHKALWSASARDIHGLRLVYILSRLGDLNTQFRDCERTHTHVYFIFRGWPTGGWLDE